MTTTKTDSQLRVDVIEELKWDTRVDETRVEVAVDRGVVTLTGTADSWAKKVAAQEAAHRVRGALDVANDVKVEPAGVGKRTDTQIAHAIRHALEWDALVPDREIQSTVIDGGVTLTGKVETYVQRADAERAIRNLSGVKWVLNRIEVQGPPVSAAEVRHAIEGALERHADRVADRISIKVHDGKLTVSGTAHSWGERAAILGAAAATRGVVSVEDHLVVATL